MEQNETYLYDYEQFTSVDGGSRMSDFKMNLPGQRRYPSEYRDHDKGKTQMAIKGLSKGYLLNSISYEPNSRQFSNRSHASGKILETTRTLEQSPTNASSINQFNRSTLISPKSRSRQNNYSVNMSKQISTTAQSQMNSTVASKVKTSREIVQEMEQAFAGGSERKGEVDRRSLMQGSAIAKMIGYKRSTTRKNVLGKIEEDAGGAQIVQQILGKSKEVDVFGKEVDPSQGPNLQRIPCLR